MNNPEPIGPGLQERAPGPAETGLAPGEAAGRPLPFAYAKRNGILVTGRDDRGRAVTLYRAGVPLQVFTEVRRYVGAPLVLREIPADEFDATLQSAYESNTADTMQMMGGIGEDLDLSHVAQQLPEPEDLLESEDDAPIIRLINALLTEAVKTNASDIHIEPYEHRLVVRFRVDGVLREVLEPARALAPILVSRVKVMAR